MSNITEHVCTVKNTGSSLGTWLSGFFSCISKGVYSYFVANHCLISEHLWFHFRSVPVSRDEAILRAVQAYIRPRWLTAALLPRSYSSLREAHTYSSQAKQHPHTYQKYPSRSNSRSWLQNSWTLPVQLEPSLEASGDRSPLLSPKEFSKPAPSIYLSHRSTKHFILSNTVLLC